MKAIITDDSNCFFHIAYIGESLRYIGLYLSIIPILGTMLLHPITACAANTKLTPEVYIGTSYDDNIFMSSTDEIDSSILTVSPRLELDYQTLVTNLSLTTDWDILRYFDESDLNRTNQYYQIKADHKLQERWKVYTDLRYYRDTTLNTYLEETGRVIDRVERDYFYARGKVGYTLTTVSWLSASYRYQNVQYEDDVYTSYDSHNISLYYSHQLKSEIDILYFGPSYYSRKNDLNDVKSYSFDLGWERNWSQISKSEASIGGRYSEVQYEDGSEDDSWGAKAKVEFEIQGVVSKTEFNYYHDLTTTTEGNDVNVDNLYVDYRRSLTERFGVGIKGRIVFSYQLDSGQSDVNDTYYYLVEPRVYYRLTENLTLSLQYRYQNNVEKEDGGDVTRDRNIVWLQFGYEIPFLL